MSGGVEEIYELNKFKSLTNVNEFWSILNRSRQKKSVICCNIEPDESLIEVILPNGLIKGHAYVVTTLATLLKDQTEIRLVKCHNPWGVAVEYKGDWSKQSTTWNTVSSKVRKLLLDKVNNNKGQFWYSALDEFWVIIIKHK